MPQSAAFVRRTLSNLDDLPYGPAQIAALARVVAQIETEGPEETLPDAYRLLVQAYTYGGQSEKSFVPYAKFVALYDARPELFDYWAVRSLMWENKWIPGQLREYPGVAAAQIDAALEDMAQRYATHGHGADALAMCRFSWARHRGTADTNDLYDAWLRCETDYLSDCDACVAAHRADYLFDCGRLDEGIDLVEQVLAEGRACEEEPGTIIARLQLAYLDRGAPGDEDRAIRAHRRSLDYIAKRELLTDAHASTIEFLARTQQTEAALRYIHRTAQYFRACDSDLNHLDFLTHAGAGLRMLAEDLGLADERLTLAGLPGPTTVAELWQWCRAEALRLAAAFDARNGTPCLTEQAEAAWQVRALDHRVALVPVALQTILAAHAGSPDAADVGASAGPEATDPAPRTPADYLAEAEQTFRNDPGSAAVAYLRAAQGYEALGELEPAAYAHAEAAHLAGTLDEFAEAEEEYARATALFKAAATDPARTTPVVVARSGLLTETGHWDDALRVLDEVADQLAAAEAAVAQAELSDDLRERRNHDLAVQGAMIQVARAEALAAGGDLRQGVAVAERAAEAFAAVSELRRAAAAFRLAGATSLRLDDTDRAIYGLESAFEGYGLGNDRAAQAEVASLLLPLYETAHRSADIERILAHLSGHRRPIGD